MITIGYSTRVSNTEYKKYLQKTCMFKEVEIIEKINNGEKSLTQVYNEILDESKHDIIVFCHDDIEFDTNNWGEKLMKLFEKNSDYGILGVAGTTDLVDGQWWSLKKSSTGIVNHKIDGKKWESKFSESQNDFIKQVVVLDGLFIAIDKTKIKHRFDEDFKGFHFYDLSFCFPNHLSGVKIGVTTKIRITHFSVGATNTSWEENKKQFEEKYKENIPCKLTNNKTFQEKLNFSRDSIGVGIVTYNSEDRIKQSSRTIPSWVKNFVIVNDGTPYSDDAYPENAHIIQHEKNKSVGVAKNSALKYLMDKGCEHIFIMEDDMLIKDENIFDEYIKHSVISGIKHLNFGLPNDGKNMVNGKPNPKAIIPYDEGVKIYLYQNLAGTFSYYDREVIEKIGYFDTNYFNAMEHVDHTFMSIKNNFHTPMWFFADIENSWKFIESIPNGESIINKTENLFSKQKNAITYFKRKHKHFPNEIGSVNNEMLSKILTYLYTNNK